MQGDDQAKADCDFARGNNQHHHREYLPVDVAPHAREGNKSQVSGIEHQLKAEEDHKRIALGHYAGSSNGENDCRDGQVPADAQESPPVKPVIGLPPAASAIVPVPLGGTDGIAPALRGMLPTV